MNFLRNFSTLLLLVLSIPLHAQTWSETYIPSSAGSLSIVMAIDPSGILHISNGSWYSNNRSGEFSLPVAIGSTTQFDLAADSNGMIYFIGSSAPASGCLMFASGQGGIQMMAERIDSICISATDASSPALAAEPDGTLHLVYIADDALYYRRRDTSGRWSMPLLLSDDHTGCTAPSIGIAPDGLLHVAFTTTLSLNGPATVLHLSGRNGSFTKPEVLWRNAMNLNNYGVVLVIDRSGGCHLFFAMNWGRPVVLHTERIDGTWSTPDTVLAINPSVEHLINIQAAVAGSGRIQVTVAYWDSELDTTGATLQQNVSHVTGTAGNWCRRRPMPTATRYRLFPTGTIYGVRYMAARDSLMAMAYHYWEGSTYHVAVATALLPTAPYLTDLPDTIDFGSVPIRECSDASLHLVSSGSPSHVPLHLLSHLAAVDGSDALTTTAPAALMLADGDTTVIRLNFCPVDTGLFTARLSFDDGYCGSRVIIRGYGYRPAARIWLDTTTARAGERAELTCRRTLPLEQEDGVDALRLILRFNPDALFPRSIASLVDNATATMRYDGEGRLLVQSWADIGTVMTGNDLLRIEFEGMITGEYHNPVVIEEVEMGETIGTYTTANGLVVLEGCGIGSDQSFGRAAGIVSARWQNQNIAIRYVAPDALPVRLRLFSLDGERQVEHDLPSGTGEEQESAVWIGSLSPGLYLLQLATKSDHAATIIVVEP